MLLSHHTVLQSNPEIETDKEVLEIFLSDWLEFQTKAIRMVASLLQTNPPTENYHESRLCICMCVCVYKHLCEGIIALARQQ